jgi:hypothetical protein
VRALLAWQPVKISWAGFYVGLYWAVEEEKEPTIRLQKSNFSLRAILIFSKNNK